MKIEVDEMASVEDADLPDLEKLLDQVWVPRVASQWHWVPDAEDSEEIAQWLH